MHHQHKLDDVEILMYADDTIIYSHGRKGERWLLADYNYEKKHKSAQIFKCHYFYHLFHYIKSHGHKTSLYFPIKLCLTHNTKQLKMQVCQSMSREDTQLHVMSKIHGHEAVITFTVRTTEY